MTAPIIPAMDGRTRGVLPYPPMQPAPRVIHLSEIEPDPDTWVLTEEHVPESKLHDRLSVYLSEVLERWAEQAGRKVSIGRNLAVRWDREHPRYGLDPDVYLVEPPPPDEQKLMSLKLWKHGHSPPKLAVEVVSRSHPKKDYVKAPEKYAASGTMELWILDPRLEGPAKTGGPHRIQIWRREGEDSFTRLYAGEGPASCPSVQGWIHFLPEREWYVLSTDREGVDRWLTPAEAERAAREAERAAREAAQRRAEAAERRVQELEALVARSR